MFLFYNILDETDKINVYVGDDDKIHFVDKAGADTALPFSKGGPGILKKYTYTGTCGFTSEQTNLSDCPASSGMYLFLTNIPNYTSLTLNDLAISALGLHESAGLYSYGYKYTASNGKLIIYPSSGGRFTRGSGKCTVYVIG